MSRSEECRSPLGDEFKTRAVITIQETVPCTCGNPECPAKVPGTNTYDAFAYIGALGINEEGGTRVVGLFQDATPDHMAQLGAAVIAALYTSAPGVMEAAMRGAAENVARMIATPRPGSPNSSIMEALSMVMASLNPDRKKAD